MLLPGSPLLLLLPTKDVSDPFQLQRSLEMYRPRYVILYDLDVAVIRTLEVRFVSGMGRNNWLAQGNLSQ